MLLVYHMKIGFYVKDNTNKKFMVFTVLTNGNLKVQHEFVHTLYNHLLLQLQKVFGVCLF